MHTYKVYTVTARGIKKQIVEGRSKAAVLRTFGATVVAGIFEVNEAGAVIA
jgi:hypothetical protein